MVRQRLTVAENSDIFDHSIRNSLSRPNLTIQKKIPQFADTLGTVSSVPGTQVAEHVCDQLDGPIRKECFRDYNVIRAHKFVFLELEMVHWMFAFLGARVFTRVPGTHPATRNIRAP